MLGTLTLLFVVMAAMLLAHELGHVASTQLLGGRFLGVQTRGLMIGVRLSVSSLSTRQVALTLAAGPAAELPVAVAAVALFPHDYQWWILILALQWMGNVIPWGMIPNDGTRLWQMWKRGTAQTLH